MIVTGITAAISVTGTASIVMASRLVTGVTVAISVTGTASIVAYDEIIQCSTTTLEVTGTASTVAASRLVTCSSVVLEVTNTTTAGMFVWTVIIHSSGYLNSTLYAISNYEHSDTFTAASEFPEEYAYASIADSATVVGTLTPLSTPNTEVSDTVLVRNSFSYKTDIPITDAADVSSTIFDLSRAVSEIEAATVTDAIVATAVYTNLLVSSAAVSETLQSSMAPFTTNDSADISGTVLDISHLVSTTDTAVGSSVITSTGIYTDLLESAFSAGESLTYSLAAFNITDAANVGGTVFDIDRTVSITAAVTGRDVIDTVFSYTISLGETANISGSLEFGYTNTVEDTATGAEETTPSFILNQLITDNAIVVDTPLSGISYTFDFSDSAIASELLNHAGSVYSVTLRTVGTLTGDPWAKDFNSIAWVLNTQSKGLTNYDNFGFTSLAFHEGKLYATSPEGIFELGADSDDGRNINAIFKGGFFDLNTENKKRISDIYVGYTGGELECDIETYDNAGQVYTYPMEQRDAEAPRNNRLKIGRGLSSRYWRLAFRNIGGANFQIYDVAVEVATSKRRL